MTVVNLKDRKMIDNKKNARRSYEEIDQIAIALYRIIDNSDILNKNIENSIFRNFICEKYNEIQKNILPFNKIKYVQFYSQIPENIKDVISKYQPRIKISIDPKDKKIEELESKINLLINTINDLNIKVQVLDKEMIQILNKNSYSVDTIDHCNKKNKNIQILIIGANSDQTQCIQKSYPSIKIVGIHSLNKNNNKIIQNYNHIIGMTKFMSHESEDFIKNNSYAFNKYIRTTGGTSSVKKIIEEFLLFTS